MIEQSGAMQMPGNTAQTGKILRMVKNERMGGFVPAWQDAQSAGENVQANLARAANPDTVPDGRLAYRAPRTVTGTPADKPFGFADLLDMVNPLQHIPLVGGLYRRFTGDEIRPIAQIIGGAVFGGPAGAASGLVSAVIRAETGRDMGDNALALALGEKASPSAPETALARAANGPPEPLSALPGTALAFADLRAPSEAPAMPRSRYNE